MAEVAHRRYAEIMKDVEDMLDDHSELANCVQMDILACVHGLV